MDSQTSMVSEEDDDDDEDGGGGDIVFIEWLFYFGGVCRGLGVLVSCGRLKTGKKPSL